MRSNAGCGNKFVVTAKLLSTLAITRQDCCCYLLVPGNSHGARSSPPPKRAQLICVALLSLIVFSLKQTHTSHSVCMHVSLDARVTQWPSLISSNISHSGVLSCTFPQAWSEKNGFSCAGWIGADWLDYKLQLFRRMALTPCCTLNSAPGKENNSGTGGGLRAALERKRNPIIPQSKLPSCTPLPIFSRALVHVKIKQ